jgi:hypothetical protein
MVAATSQVKLCPYDEEEPAIRFCLIEAEFAAAASNPRNSGIPMLWPACPSIMYNSMYVIEHAPMMASFPSSRSVKMGPSYLLPIFDPC